MTLVRVPSAEDLRWSGEFLGFGGSCIFELIGSLRRRMGGRESCKRYTHLTRILRGVGYRTSSEPKDTSKMET
jgi:hypothetical protein